MNHEQNMANFYKCLDYLKSKMPKLGGRRLYIGYGAPEYNHPWNKESFQNHEYSLQINDTWNDLPIQVMTYGCVTMDTYGFEKSAIKKWEDGYKGTGMSCPHNRFTWEDLDVVPFLLDWQHIKKVFDTEVAKYDALENFQI